MRFAVGEVTGSLLECPEDFRLVTAQVSSDPAVALGSITFEALLKGSDELIDPNGWRSTGVVLSSLVDFSLFLTCFTLPPNIHDQGPVQPSPISPLCCLSRNGKEPLPWPCALIPTFQKITKL